MKILANSTSCCVYLRDSFNGIPNAHWQYSIHGNIQRTTSSTIDLLCISYSRRRQSRESVTIFDILPNYNNFSIFQLAPFRHVGFSKSWFPSNASHSSADFPSLCQMLCKNVDRRQNYGPKSKSKMAAVRHLENDASSYRNTHEVFSLGHISPSNFMQIRCIALKRFEFFCRFGLKCLFTPPPNFRF